MDLTRQQSRFTPYVLAALSAILLLLSFPPVDLGFLAWLAMVPLLYVLAKTDFQKKREWGLSYYRVQLFGIVFGVVFYYGTLSWLFTIFGSLSLPLISILIFYAFVFSFALSFLWSRWKNAPAMILFPPVLWVAIEYIKSEGWWAKFAWLNLGYTQHDCLPVLQFAAVFGQYGLSFLIMLANSAIVFVIINRTNRRSITRVASAAIVLISVILLYGITSLRRNYEPDMKVGLVQDESSDFGVYERMTNGLPDDVDFVVWPEYAIPEFIEEDDSLLNRLGELARSKSCHLVVGAKQRAETYSSNIKARMMRKQKVSADVIDETLKFYNTAYLFSPDGKIVGRYHKVNPIQFFNDGVAGREFPSFETPNGRAGICICYDADYSYTARRIVRDGAEFLLVPTYDAASWSARQHEQHSAMTSMRAVENRRFIARATTSGISQIIDPSGRMTGHIDNGISATTTGYVQRIREISFYTRYGYLLPFVCIALSIGLILAAISRRPAPAEELQKVLPQR